ncbi:MAG: hypothetical protein PHS57_02200 [Alphaproteobacteria bacterium]|nr:hypothetical protein [Alphaproteobacteria bacterium]
MLESCTPQVYYLDPIYNLDVLPNKGAKVSLFNRAALLITARQGLSPAPFKEAIFNNQNLIPAEAQGSMTNLLSESMTKGSDLIIAEKGNSSLFLVERFAPVTGRITGISLGKTRSTRRTVLTNQIKETKGTVWRVSTLVP